MADRDRPISVVSRDTSSGTYEVWEEKVLKGDKVRADALLVASSGQTVQTVAQNKFAIGYVGIGYIDKSVKALKLAGSQPLQAVCVTTHGLSQDRSSCILMESLQELSQNSSTSYSQKKGRRL